MALVTSFYNSGMYIQMSSVTGNDASTAIDYVYPKSTLVFVSDSNSLHLFSGTTLLHMLPYAQISTTQPAGHNSVLSLITVLRQWCRQGTDCDPYRKDAFQRNRVATAVPVLAATFRASLESAQFDNIVTTGGSLEWDSNEASAIITTSNTEADARVVFQARRYICSNLSSSLITVITMVARTTAAVANNTVRFGLFDQYSDKAETGDRFGSGAFFQLEANGSLSAVVRRMVNGAEVDIVTPQTQFNVDCLNGTGASGMTYNPTLLHAYIIETSGDGLAARFAIYRSNNVWCCHLASTLAAQSYPAIRNGGLPLRIESLNTGTSDTSSITKLASCTIYMESPAMNDMLMCRPIAVDFGICPDTDLPMSGDAVPLFSVRLAAGNRCRIPVWITSIFICRTSGTAVSYSIIQDPSSLDEANWTAPSAISGTKYDVSATAVSGGTVVYSSCLMSGNSGGLLGTAVTEAQHIQLSQRLPLMALLDGSGGTTYSLVAKRWAGAASAAGKLDWVEHCS
jgi:hypothetical protein